jgi:hypothetical protein
MLKQRTFQFVLISKDNPAGFSFTPQATHVVTYQQKEMQVHFN